VVPHPQVGFDGPRRGGVDLRCQFASGDLDDLLAEAFAVSAVVHREGEHPRLRAAPFVEAADHDGVDGQRAGHLPDRLRIGLDAVDDTALLGFGQEVAGAFEGDAPELLDGGLQALHGACPPALASNGDDRHVDVLGQRQAREQGEGEGEPQAERGEQAGGEGTHQAGPFSN
jgi:hypothetical protein